MITCGLMDALFSPDEAAKQDSRMFGWLPSHRLEAPDVPFGGGADPQSTHEACVDVSRVERVHESKSHGIFRHLKPGKVCTKGTPDGRKFVR